MLDGPDPGTEPDKQRIRETIDVALLRAERNRYRAALEKIATYRTDPDKIVCWAVIESMAREARDAIGGGA